MTASSDERSAALARDIAALVSRGRRIETHDTHRAVLVRGRVLERRELLTVSVEGTVMHEDLPIDRERVLILIGLTILAIALLSYVIVSAITGSTDPGGGSPPI